MKPQPNPNEHWQETGKTYYRNFNFSDVLVRYQKRRVIGYLKNTISQDEVRTVLEIGCGFGRYTKLILNLFTRIQQYRAIDLSFDQLEYAKKYVNDNRVHYILKSIQDYEDTQKYDLVFAGEVFFQVSPEDIEDVMQKTLLLTEKHLIHVDPEKQYVRVKLYFFDNAQNVKEFAFFHDYNDIIKKIDIRSSQKYVPLKKIHQAIHHVSL